MNHRKRGRTAVFRVEQGTAKGETDGRSIPALQKARLIPREGKMGMPFTGRRRSSPESSMK